MNKKKPKNFNSNRNGFKRNCMNCINHNHCEDENHISAIKKYMQWCGKFTPFYAKIDRIEHNRNLVIAGGQHTMRAMENASMIQVLESAEALQKVERVLRGDGAGGETD